jgi:hypothetical protein
MANYFSVALIGMTRSWLMNLPVGSLTSWGSCAISSQPTLRVHTLTQAMRSTSMPCNSAWGSHCGPSSVGSPRFKHHHPHLQRFCCCRFLIRRER